MKKEAGSENRKQVRYTIRKDAYVAWKDGETRVGKIADISMGGLAFHYVEEDPLGLERGRIDIFTSGKRFYLPDIPVRVIYEKCQPINESDPSDISMNRCGMAFDRLTEVQVFQLKALLDDHPTYPTQTPSLSFR